MEEKDLFKRTRKASLYDAVFVTGSFGITQGFIITGLAFIYGFSELLLSLVIVIPVIAQLIQIIAPLILLKIGSRKKALMIFVTFSRLSVVLIPLTLAFGIKYQSVLIIVIAVLYMCNSIASISWISIMKEAVPAEVSGKFYGKRNLLSSLFSMGLTYFFSLILDKIPGEKGFLVVTGIASVFAVLDIFTFHFHHAKSFSMELKNFSFSQPLTDPRFRKFLLFTCFWNFSLAVSSPFFAYFQMANLHLPYSYMGLMNAITSVFAMVFYIIWGKVNDRIGSGSIMEFTVFLVIFLPLSWVFTTEKTIILIPINAALSGILWSAVNLSNFTTMLTLFPSSKSESYFASMSFANGLGALFGSIVGGLIAQNLKGSELVLFGLKFYGIQWIFLLASFLRFFSWRLLKRVRVVGEISLPKHFYDITSTLARRTASRIVEFPSIYAKLTEKKNKSGKR